MATQQCAEDLVIEEYGPTGEWSVPTESFICWVELAPALSAAKPTTV